MNAQSSAKPPDEYAMILQQCKSAPLVCHTLFEEKWNMSFGFTAENIFYKTNEFSGISSEFIHDEKTLRIISPFSAANNTEDTLTTIFKYDSFQRFNLNIKKSVEFCDSFEVDLIFVTKYTPMFFYRLWNQQGQRFDRGRYVHQFRSDAIDGQPWNDLINASAFKISYYNIEKTKVYSWLKEITEKLPCSITYNQMFEEQYRRHADRSLLDSNLSKWPSDAKYYVACILSLGTIGEFLLNYYLFEKNNLTMLKNLGKREQWYLISKYFCSIFKFLEKDISLSSLNFNPNEYPDEIPLGNHYVAIKLAVITPTHVRFVNKELVVNNRGIRRYGPQMFLKIIFRDEDMGNFPKDEDLLNARIGEPLINGISVGGKRYFEFGSSSSQFRQHGTFFFQAESKQAIIQLLNQWAEFKIEQAAKVSARIGQLFSSSLEINFKLKSKQIGRLGEVVSPPHTFSDGIGVIDARLARQIQHELGLPTMPSAIQFRCLGCKGMVTTDFSNKRLISNGGDYDVMFRESQVKFMTVLENEIDFDVVKCSASGPLKLHKTFIAILIALAKDQGKLEVVERRIHELFTSTFIEILKSLYDTKAFEKALRSLPKHFPTEKFYPEQLIQEPFFRSIVEVNAVSSARLLNSKSHILFPSDLGRIVFGVLDESGTLRPGEIFFQYTQDVLSKSSLPELIILRGKAGITKAPMFHLGDIRYVTAVDCPSLHHLFNVVVFSRHGRRPLADEIGGGDLDGDEFSIFWDPAFMLKHSKAADFPPPDTSSLKNVSVEELLHHAHAEFTMDYQRLNNLENISNCYISHLALHHPEHQEVEKIAKKGDVAVNSFKSGIFAAAIQPDEKPVFFPAYMNKRHEPVFQNSHILNNIQSRSMKIYLMMQLVQDKLKNARMMQPKIEVVASQYAKNMYEKYCLEITNIMDTFNIKSEAELFANVTLEPAGCVNSFNGNEKSEESRQEIVQTMLSKIIQKFRTAILNRFKPNWKTDMLERNETISSYIIPSYQIPEEMKILANEFQQLSENGKFVSFKYLIMEAQNFPLNNNWNRSVVEKMNGLIWDYNSMDLSNPVNRKQIIATEALLIETAFGYVPSSINESHLDEYIISYPSFVITVPDYYSQAFKENFKNLQEMCGLQDIAIRMKRNKGRYHHYTVACNGTMESCINVEEKLTPFIHFDASFMTFKETRQRITRAMNEKLEEVFGFTPPQVLHHSHTTPARLNASTSNNRFRSDLQPNNSYPRMRNDNPERQRY